MTDLSPGQEVTVSNGGPATVVYQRGPSVRVRMTSTGKERTVDLARVTTKRESKALSVSAEDLAAARQLGMRHPSIPNPLTRPFERTVESAPRPVPKPVTLRSEPYLAMPEPTFGHQPMTRGEARAEYLRTLAKLDGVEVPHVLVQPDDPGRLTTCLRCGFDEGLGAMRLCARCCPPAPFWAHILRWLPCVARRWGL